MPRPSKPDDPDYETFEYRAAIAGFEYWRGVVKEGSPAWPADNQLRDCLNIRPVGGGGYKSRGGLSKGATTSTSSAIDGIWDASDSGAAV